MDLKRFGVSLEEDLLQALDEFVEKKQFPNRSRAIRYLITNTLIQEKIANDQPVAGSLVIVYDHHQREVNTKLLDIQHDYHELILCNQHVHLAHDLCLETIALKGRADQLALLADKIVGIKGIKHGKLVITDVE